MKFEIMLNLFFQGTHNFVRHEADCLNAAEALAFAHAECEKGSGAIACMSVAWVKTAAMAHYEAAQKSAVPCRPNRLVPRGKNDVVMNDEITLRFRGKKSRTMPILGWLELTRRAGNHDTARSIAHNVLLGVGTDNLPTTLAA